MRVCLNGAPTATLVLRHSGASSTVPTEIDVLIREIDDEESWVYVGTVGMSMVPLNGPIERAELMMRIEGKHKTADLEKLARRLGDVAVAPFRKGFGLAVEMILDEVDLPLYSGMSSLLLTRWPGEFDHLPGIDPPVALLNVTPLFPREAETVRRIGAREAFARFWAEDVNPADPERAEAALKEREVGPDDEARDPEQNVRSIDEIWDELETWLAANAPRVHSQLRPGTSAERLQQLEAAVDRSCPPDLRAWFQRHDGGRELGAYDFLRIGGLESLWHEWNEMVGDGSVGDGRAPNDQTGHVFQPVWWHKAWLPVAQDGSGNLICIDLDPGPRGIRGQVLFWERQTGPEASGLPSIAAWFDAFLDGLKRGKYVVNAEGLIERSFEK
jgi:cell wall assembly regulator SMI1